ncbi:MAG: glucoamylase family protein [Pyrinomonadaceae bacterium]
MATRLIVNLQFTRWEGNKIELAALYYKRLEQILRPFVCVVFIFLLNLSTAASVFKLPPPDLQSSRKLRQVDEAFLDDLQKRAFQFFWDQADPTTGLVPDRARLDGTLLDENHRNVASTAATGFGLTALCIAAERQWVGRQLARERVRNTLRFFDGQAFSQHGWFYHWLDMRTGERRWTSEISSIDTALLLAGVLTAGRYFNEDPEIPKLANAIYRRVDFRWMLNGDPLLLSHGWKPESGFLRPRWDTYSEDTILYLLAIASPTHPISPQSWYALWRDRYRYENYRYFTTIGVPLFMHQYAHAWIDYRNRRETRGDRIDYFQNSIIATLAHRAFCINLSRDFPAFGPTLWGITASDSAKGYLAWGGPPRDPEIDGTIVPAAAGGSLMFTPELSAIALRQMKARFGDRVYTKYGFVDAFNPQTGWVDTDVIGINVGIILLSAENARTGNVWRWFMQNVGISRAMQGIGLQQYRRRSTLPKDAIAPAVQ